MRSRLTNILQVIVLVTGILFFIIGMLFYVSPMSAFGLFAKVENIDNWLSMVQSHEFVGPLYFFLRSLGGILIAVGLSSILPLFDPLRYRGWIYFNGVFASFLAGIVLILHSFNKNSSDVYVVTHFIVLLLGLIFTGIAIFNLFGLLITRKEAKEGIE